MIPELQSIVKATSEPSEDLLSSRMWRRRVREQNMLRKDLSSNAAVTAWSIADLLHDTSTTSGNDTIAHHVGLKQYQAAAGVKELVEKGQARTPRRDNGTRDTFLILRNDIDIEYLPPVGARRDKSFYKTGRYRDFIKERGKLVDQIMAHKSLTATDKRIGFAATRFLDMNDWTVEESIGRIGEVVGLSADTARRSMEKLIRAGYFQATKVPGKRNILRVKFADASTLQLWQRLYDFLTGDYAKTGPDGEPRQTMGGIRVVTQRFDWTEGNGGFEPSEVQHFVRAGLLARGPKWITITERGHDAYENGVEDDVDERKVA